MAVPVREDLDFYFLRALDLATPGREGRRIVYQSEQTLRRLMELDLAARPVLDGQHRSNGQDHQYKRYQRREHVESVFHTAICDVLAVATNHDSRAHDKLHALAVTLDDKAHRRYIIGAVRDGTAQAIESAVKANWINGAERLRLAMSRAGPRGDW